MSYVRTILGDVEPTALGACGAHEHVVIDSAHMREHYAELVLSDVDGISVELKAFRDAGGGAVVDTMPGGAGRDAGKLAEVSRRSGVHIVGATGLHLPRYYPAEDSRLILNREELAELFRSEISVGMEDTDGRRGGRAGVIKVAGDAERLSAHQREAFAGAGIAHGLTGCPIITHCEQGTAGLEQVERLLEAGASAGHVVLSHTDRVHDVGYHRELLSSGVCLEYDGAMRWPDRSSNPTLALLAELLPEYSDQLMVGMDLARRAYWASFGGGPGLVWLMRELPGMLRERGIDDALIDKLYTVNPARVFSFVSVATLKGA